MLRLLIAAYDEPFRPGGVLRRVGPDVARRCPVIHHQSWAVGARQPH
jgi:hypothetical protein